MQSAGKVGGFVVLFGIMFLGVYALLQKSVFAKPTEKYFALFSDAGGLTTGTPVLMSGVQIGTVEAVDLVRPGEAKVTLAVERGRQIPSGSEAVLPASLISFGDKQVLIVPGATTTAFLIPGDTLAGTQQKPLDNLLPDSEATVEELNKTLVAVRTLLEDESLKGGVKNLMATSEQTVAQFGKLAGRLDQFIAKNQGTVAGLIATTQKSLMNLQAVSEEIRKVAASGELQGKTTALLDNLNAAVKQGQSLVADLQSTLNDPTLKNSIQDTLANFKTMSESGTRIAVDAEAMAKNGVTISAETVELMKKANKLADEVDGLIQKFKETVDRLQGGGKSLLSGISGEASLVRETEPNRNRADVNVTVPLGSERVTLGLYDAFESNKVNLQLHKALSPDLDLRYGVYASKPGVGVDYALAPRLGLRSDVFGLNNPQWDVRMRYDFGGGIFGWFGVERLLKRNSPALGIGIRK